MAENPTPTALPWRFVAVEDIPEIGVFRGDIIVAVAGGKTRVLRELPVNPGLLLNLAMLDRITEIDGVIGAQSPIVDAMDSASTSAKSHLPLRVVR